jgi:hypothetical protein
LDSMCQLPDAGMKFPNSIGERSGLDSHCCPPIRYAGSDTILTRGSSVSFGSTPVGLIGTPRKRYG